MTSKNQFALEVKNKIKKMFNPQEIYRWAPLIKQDQYKSVNLTTNEAVHKFSLIFETMNCL